MDDWDDERIPPRPAKAEVIKHMWDDEDADENDVKDSWEDEEEPAPAPVVVEATAKKPSQKPAANTNAKKGKTIEVEVPLDPVAEKLRQQRLVEEADFKSTAELFAKKGNDDKTLGNFIPKSEADFLEYAELVSHKLRPYEKSFHYVGLLKAVMRVSMTHLKAADAKEISSSITAITNEKLKAEKESNAGKKKTVKKKSLLMDKPDDDMVVSAYDVADDYDFM